MKNTRTDPPQYTRQNNGAKRGGRLLQDSFINTKTCRTKLDTFGIDHKLSTKWPDLWRTFLAGSKGC